jgi:hypothetical protein
MTVKECVLQILQQYPHLSNEEVAGRVRHELDSQTTAKNVAWYKWKMGQTDELPQVEVTDEEAETIFGFGEASDEEEVENWAKAEEIVASYERNKGAQVKRISKEATPGYDIISKYTTGETRLIEVKSKKKGKMTWLNLTSNETTALMNEPDFWLYIVEGDPAKGALQIVEVSRLQLLKAVKIKLHGRISNLSGYSRINYEL